MPRFVSEMSVFGFLKRKTRQKESTTKASALPETPPPSSSKSAPHSSAPAVSDELLPIVTLLAHQQRREYYIGEAEYMDHSVGSGGSVSASMDWKSAQIELRGSNLSVMDQVKPVYINVCDCEIAVSGLEVEVFVTERSRVAFRFATEELLVDFYSALLLAKFEYTQLQEAYTGALLSSEAIHFSDIRTLLDPNNRKHSKEEWCVLRFPYLNGKWIRGLVVVKPTKVEVYLNANKAKKHLLSTIVEGKSAHGVYSGHPSAIRDNSLLRLWGDCYIDVDLLTKLLSEGAEGTTSKPLSKRLSIGSLRSHESLSSSNGSKRGGHRRVASVDTQLSDASFSSKTPKKLVKRDIVQTHLAYIIPEAHGGIKPVEILLRMVIPVMNTFELYGRPDRFISSRTERDSLLFGLPQLPNSHYLSTGAARDLVGINLENSLREGWGIFDWNMVFKELVAMTLESQPENSSQPQVVNVKYEKPVSVAYDPQLDFVEA